MKNTQQQTPQLFGAARPVCQHCKYPIKTCVCSAIKPIKLPISIVIIQDHKETLHAKNTVRLLKLCCDNTEIVINNNTQSMIDLQQRAENMPANIALLFPSAASMPINSLRAQHRTKTQLWLIDATWRRAKRILFEHPWLAKLDSFHLNEHYENRYHIRKASVKGSLSSLEAAAHALQDGFNIDAAALFTALDKMQSHWPVRPQNKVEKTTKPA